MIPIVMVTVALFFIAGVVNDEKNKLHKKRALTGVLVFWTLLYVAIFLKVSFFNDAFDYVLLTLLIFLGPVILMLQSSFKSLLVKAVSRGFFLMIGSALIFFLFFIYIFGSPSAVSEQISDNGQVVKVGTRGGATAACNYEIRRTVSRFLIFERETGYEKILLTPELPRCSDK